MVTGEIGFDVEMRGAPVPTLRNDTRPAKSHAGIGVDPGQQRSEFGGDADAGLTLQHARLDDIFEKRAGGLDAGLATAGDWRQHFGLEHRFPAIGETVVVYDEGRHRGRLRSRPLPAERLKLNFNLVEVGDPRVRAVEGTIGRSGLCVETQRGQDGPARPGGKAGQVPMETSGLIGF